MTISSMAAAGRRWRMAPTCSRSCAASMSASPASSRRPKPMAGSWSRRSSAAASPSAHVTKDAFERVMKEMVDGIAAAGPIDAVYLDLHGAMVTEHLRRRRRRNACPRAQGDRQGPAAGREPRPPCQCLARDDGACGCAHCLPHLSPRRHGRHRPRLCKTSRADAEDEGSVLQKRSGNCRS